MSELKTIKEFISENGITIDSKWAEKNLNNPEWNDANHYKVTLKNGRKRFSTYFSMGLGLKEKPDAVSVLECLLMDASGFLGSENWAEWAYEYGYGYDTTEEKNRIKKIYKVIAKETEKLKSS